MKVEERFLKYVAFGTQSSEESLTCPSTDTQKVLADYIAEEMKTIGIEDARVDENGYVYGSIPAAGSMAQTSVIGFISHMDTAPSLSGDDIKPRIIKDYDGTDIVLNKEKNIIMRVAEYVNLQNYIGESLIVADGTTLLGADDKAGIAEIMTAAEELIRSDASHSKIVIGFTPDEEIGRGADRFDIKAFGADYAYTVDGGPVGEVEYENFNAASALIEIHGVNIHPGDAKNKMKNAILMGMEFNGMLPAAETPEHTEGYEGFYHLQAMNGDEEHATLNYIIRDHDKDKFLTRKTQMEKITNYLNDKYGKKSFELIMKDSYYNMKEKIVSHMEIIDKAVKAMEGCGVKPVIKPIRGGTDGARLSFEGLPCPNLSTGGNNFHGRNEFISIQSMSKMVQVIKRIMVS